MTTQHVVSNDDLGMVNRCRWEVERRMMEGTLDPRALLPGTFSSPPKASRLRTVRISPQM